MDEGKGGGMGVGGVEHPYEGPHKGPYVILFSQRVK